jgi:hypothetical protein
LEVTMSVGGGFEESGGCDAGSALDQLDEGKLAGAVEEAVKGTRLWRGGSGIPQRPPDLE